MLIIIYAIAFVLGILLAIIFGIKNQPKDDSISNMLDDNGSPDFDLEKAKKNFKIVNK